jgi:hypothetical protein
MSKQDRLLRILASAAGGLAATAFLPMAFAQADDCALGECTLVSGGQPTNVEYSGFRPFIAVWNDDQPVNVEVTQAGGTSYVSGSYIVSEQDYESRLNDHAIYNYSAFTPNTANNPTGIDSEGLAGAKVNDWWHGPFGTDAGGDTTFSINKLNVYYADGAHAKVITVPGDHTEYFYNDGHEGGAWILDAGQTTPHMLWDSLPSSEFPSTYFSDLLQNVMPPDDWFPLGNGDLGNVADLSHVAAELGSVADLASLTPDMASATADLASLTPDLASLIP